MKNQLNEFFQNPEEKPKVDLTVELRQDIVKQLQEIKEKNGWISSEKAMLLLLNYIEALEKQLAIFCSDITSLVEIIAKTQVSHFGLRTNVKAVVRDLCRKNITTEAELFAIHQKEIVPEELPKEQREEYFAALAAFETEQSKDLDK